MFSFASKMLNTLMGEGENGGPPSPQQQQLHSHLQQQQQQHQQQHQLRGPPQPRPSLPRVQQMSYPRPQTMRPLQQPTLQQRPQAPYVRPMGPEEPNLDLSHLSAEERALIENVMAKAEAMEPVSSSAPIVDQAQQHQFRMSCGSGTVLMDPMRHDNFGGIQQRNSINQSDMQNANRFQQQQQHSVHQKQDFSQHQDQFQRSQEQSFVRLQDQQSQKPPDQQYPGPLDQQFSRSQEPPFQRPPDQQFPAPTDQQFQRPQEQTYNTKPDNFSYKTEQYQQNPDHFQGMPDHLQQRLDNFQMKQQDFSPLGSTVGSTRKEFGLQRQDSYTTQKTTTSPYFHNTSWENGEKDELGKGGGTVQLGDCEYSTPSPQSNSPEIRLSPSPPPGSPSSEDNRTATGLLAPTTKDEAKAHLTMETFYDHSPGEVYTIPEEEEELSSPTSDGVTSLRKRRLVGAQLARKEEPTSYQPPGSTSQYRNNNNFSNSNLSVTKAQPPANSLGNDNANGKLRTSQDSLYGKTPYRKTDSLSDSIKQLIPTDPSETRYQAFLEKNIELSDQAINNLLQQQQREQQQRDQQQRDQQLNGQTFVPNVEKTDSSSMLGLSDELYPYGDQLQRSSQTLQQQTQKLTQQPLGASMQSQLSSQSSLHMPPANSSQSQMPANPHLAGQPLHNSPLHSQPLLQGQPSIRASSPQVINQQHQVLQSQSNPQQQLSPTHQQLQFGQGSQGQHQTQPQYMQHPQQPLQQPYQQQQQQQHQQQQLHQQTPQQQQQMHSQQQQQHQQMHQQQQQQQMHQQQVSQQMQQQQSFKSALLQQHEAQYQQIKKLQQQIQRQQISSRAKTQLAQQNKQSEGLFSNTRPEAPFYMQEDTWREVPDDMNQGYPREYAREQSFFSRNKSDKYPVMQNELGELDKQQQNQSNAQAKPSAGTISGMLADFSRALGLSNNSSQNDDKLEEEGSYSQDSKTQNKPNPQSIQAQIRANEQFMHGGQMQNFDQTSMDNRQMLQQMDNELKYQNSRFQIPQQYQSLPNQQLLHQELQQQFQKIGAVQTSDQQASLAQQKQDFQALLEADQKMLMMQQNQQSYQKLPEHQPIFIQNLTPQQQQMYQQHMQLQHHAQHLKKVKRSLPPHSTAEQQKLQQRNTKESNLNLLSQSQAVGSGVSIQQMMAAQFLSQSNLPVQIIGNQLVSNPLLTADKLTAQQRLLGSSPPILVSSGLTHQSMNAVVTPLGTPQSTPVGTPRGTRDGGDSSDTMSETDSQKSLRTRRKLPSIPSDQEAITFQNSKKGSRGKTKSPHDKFGSYSPLRQYSDGGYKLVTSSLMLQRPSSSETNLRKITSYGDTTPRPGSALGLLQGSSVVSSTGYRMEYNRDSEIASCLPPDLRHLLNSYKSSDMPYSKQQIIQSFKDHLGSDSKLPLSDRRSLNRLSSMDWETDRLLQRNKELLRNPKSRLDIQRKMVYSGVGRTRKLRTHRRQLSDPKIHTEMSSLNDGSDPQYSRSYYGIPHPSLRPPYKSYEYESIDDGKLSEWDSSHPYLASYAVAGGALRETAINSVLDKELMNSDSIRYDLRRYSDSLDLRRRDLSKHHKPRSWQPSPYGSDEDEDQLSREQKKAKIKAEIARRRQQIEENARLHEELLRLARLRESAELGYAPLANTQALSGDYAMSSVLKSIDDLIGRESVGDYVSHRTAEDRSMDRIASTFRTDDYTSCVYERLTDFSPIADYSTPHAMPLLPDMPTRSRKLLEDLGSSPITESMFSMQKKEQRAPYYER